VAGQLHPRLGKQQGVPERAQKPLDETRYENGQKIEVKRMQRKTSAAENVQLTFT
jgi:hypothetical protein